MAGSLSQTLRLVVKGDAKGAVGALRGLDRGLTKSGRTGGTFGHMLRKGALLAAAGFAMLVAGLYVAMRVLRSCFAAYQIYMKTIVTIQRLTGLTAVQSSILAGQMRLSGIETTKTAVCMGFFAKNLDAARQGTKAAQITFERLHVDLKDGNGHWRTAGDLLPEIQRHFAAMEDPIARTALATKLFGKSGRDMLPWLTKTPSVLAEFTKYLRSLGIVMTEKTEKAFKEFNLNKRKLSFGWDAIKINAAAALVPIFNKLLPSVIRLITRAAGWMGRFRALVEKKGLGKAIQEMVPGAESVVKVLKKMKRWWDENRSAVYGVLKAVMALIEKVAYVLSLLNRLGSGKSGTPSVPNLNIPDWLLPPGTSAAGGVFTRPQVRLIGEAGAEAIIPLTRPRRAAQVMAQAGIGGVGPITIPIFLDGRQIAAYTVDLMTRSATRLARGYS